MVTVALKVRTLKHVDSDRNRWPSTSTWRTCRSGLRQHRAKQEKKGNHERADLQTRFWRHGQTQKLQHDECSFRSGGPHCRSAQHHNSNGAVNRRLRLCATDDRDRGRASYLGGVAHRVCIFAIGDAAKVGQTNVSAPLLCSQPQEPA